MTLTSFNNIYALVMHISGMAALVVLMATGHLTTDVGIPLLSGLMGLGVGVAVSPNGTATTTTSTPIATTSTTQTLP